MIKTLTSTLILALSALALNATELLKNGNLESWQPAGTPTYWVSNSVTEEKAIIHDIYPSAKVEGHTGQLVQRVMLTPGTRYQVSGWVYNAGEKNYGCIGIRTGNYKWKLRLNAKPEVGEWQHLTADYVADGTEVFFYCFNFYIGKRNCCYYSELSIKELPPKKSSAK